MSTTEDEQSTGEGQKDPSPAQKRPYRTPELRRLGSVAELTLGGGNTAIEGRSGNLKSRT
jgi:hypothetical protein